MTNATQAEALTESLLGRIREAEARVMSLITTDSKEVGGLKKVYYKPSDQHLLNVYSAMRAIVGLHGPEMLLGETHCRSCGDVPQVAFPCETLSTLVAVYGPPDFRA